MKIKCIFFDFDGVLAESVNVKTEAFRKMYLPYGHEFAEKVVAHHQANGGISRFEKFRIYNGSWLNQELSDEKIKILSDEFSNLVVDGVIHAPEVPGAYAFLKNNPAYKKFIITGTPTVEIIPILERRNMSHFFDGIYGSPEKKEFWVNEILNMHSLSPNECVFVGDALTDYNAAVVHNLHFILRETEEGFELFKNQNVIRIKDLTHLSDTIDLIEKL
ncbi:MAG: HAD hydrolase-like protein [Bacteroidetes bacterium]|nr:HAD hydrolase-like protein [Bacteroidota bacterium]